MAKILLIGLAVVAFVIAGSSFALAASGAGDLGGPMAVLLPARTAIDHVVSSHNYGVGFDTAPTIVDSIAYVGTRPDRTGLAGSVVAIDLKENRLLWQTKVSNWIMSDPLVVPEKGLVFSGSGNSLGYTTLPDGRSARGSGENYVYAMDMQTGQIRWQYRTQGHNMPNMLYRDGIVYWVNGDRNLYAVDAETGREVWKLDVESFNSMSSPAIGESASGSGGQTLYFGGAEPWAVYAVNLRDRRIEWQTVLPNVNGMVDDTPPALDGGFVYTNGANQSGGVGDGYFFKLDAATGRIVWSQFLGHGVVGTSQQPDQGSTPTVMGKVVYSGANARREVVALDTATGRVIWRRPVGDPINAPPLVLGNIVYAVTTKGKIYALNRDTGRQIGTRQLDGSVVAGGWQYADHRIHVVTKTGTVYVLD